MSQPQQRPARPGRLSHPPELRSKTMILTVACSACSTSFPVDPRKVPAEGVYARCSKCEEVFFVEVATPVAELAPSAAPEEEVVEAPAIEEEEIQEAAQGVASDALDFGSTLELEGESDATEDVEETDDWVFEVEPDLDTSGPEIERLDTVEEGLRTAREESPQVAEPSTPTWFEEEAPEDAPAPEPVVEVPPPPAPTPPAPPSQPTAPAKPITFGRRDPHEKASRLARVLVSDMIAYNPDRHQQALDGDTLKEDFEEEIVKSMAEYVEQVGRELAESTDYFQKALNEVLARGEQVF